MLAKMTAKNQITLPQSVTAQLPAAEYFEVRVEAGRLVLTPIQASKADAVRDRLAQLGLDETDIADAVAWARQPE